MNNTPSKFSFEEFNKLWKHQEERKASEFKQIQQSILESEIPLSDDLLDRIIDLSPAKSMEILRLHTGFPLNERREHYHSSLLIMKDSLKDLEEALINFENQATLDDAEIMRFKNKKQLEAIKRCIQKELFSVTNAAASLVDHSRRLNSRFKFNNYDAQREKHFGNDGLHDLIIGLRVLLHHLHIVKAGWSLTSNHRTGIKGANFMITREVLERALVQYTKKLGAQKTQSIQNFISQFTTTIDLLKIFQEYQTRLYSFHNWLTKQIKDYPPEALKDYDRCILKKNRHATRIYWNALIGNWLNWKSVPDIHKYLPDYLAKEDLKNTYALPRNSKKQANFIIQCLDEYGAIDASLRQRIYSLFKRLDAQEKDLHHY